jgi:hypothetical protein
MNLDMKRLCWRHGDADDTVDSTVRAVVDVKQEWSAFMFRYLTWLINSSEEAYVVSGSVQEASRKEVTAREC